MPAHRHRALVTAVAWLLVAPGAAWAGIRTSGLDRGWPAIQLIAFTPYVAAWSPFPVVLASALRRWPAAIAGGLACLALAGCVLPRALAADPPDDGVPVRVMAANLRAGGADIATVVGLVREHRVDILALQEVTPEATAMLASAGIGDLLPHHHLNPLPGVPGSALYSRFPIRDAAVTVNPGGFTQVMASPQIPGTASVVVESVHPVAPSGRAVTPYWRDGLRAQSPAQPDGPLRILAGDFNATLDHAELRRLIDTGYLDAATHVGTGLTPTWPFYGRRVAVTPKVTLDHILADRRIGVRDFAAFAIPRTDHRAILATLVLPRS